MNLVVYAMLVAACGLPAADTRQSERSDVVEAVRSALGEEERLSFNDVLKAAARAEAAPEVSSLIVDSLLDPDPDTRFQALVATEGFASNIGEPPGALRSAVVARLRDSEFTVRYMAVLVLKEIGVEDPESAIPPLIDLLRYDLEEKHLPHSRPRGIFRLAGDADDYREAVTSTLASPGELAVPPLVEALSGGNQRIRAGAARALGKIGKRAAGASAPLEKLLESPDRRVRLQAARALWRIDQRVDDTLPVLVTLLREPSTGEDGASLEQAVDTIEEMGPRASSAVPVLLKTLERGRGVSRRSVLSALGAIGPSAKAAVPAFLEALESRSDFDRLRAAVGLWEIQESAARSIDTLIELLDSRQTVIRKQAAEELGGVDIRKDEVRQALETSLRSEKSDWVRRHIREALLGLEADSGEEPGEA